MGQGAAERPAEDLGESRGSDAERIPAGAERGDHVGTVEDCDSSGDRFGGGADRFLQVERLLSEGGDEVSADLGEPEGREELDEVSGYRRVRRRRFTVQFYGDWRESRLYTCVDCKFVVFSLIDLLIFNGNFRETRCFGNRATRLSSPTGRSSGPAEKPASPRASSISFPLMDLFSGIRLPRRSIWRGLISREVFRKFELFSVGVVA